MFKSKTRPICVPQVEHARQVGAFAAAWGNPDFDTPALDPDSFAAGATLHDWHYGHADNFPIGGVSEEVWLDVVRRGVAHRFSDPVSDVVVSLHISRLLGFRNPESAARQALIAELEERVRARLAETSRTREDFDFADMIMRFCDGLSFFFCCDAPASGSVPVRARRDSEETTEVSYEILPGGAAQVSPWPFAVSGIRGVLVGYTLDGYPDALTPVVMPYAISPG